MKFSVSCVTSVVRLCKTFMPRRRFSYLLALLVITRIVGAQQTERVGRVELSNGYLSLDARSDGLVILSAVSTLKFGVGSAPFSPRTIDAWLNRVAETVDSLRRVDGATIGSAPTLFGVDAATRLDVSFEVSPAASIASAVFARSDGVEIGIAGATNDSSFLRLLDIVRRASRRTTELTLASRDSARMYLSDAELSGRTTARDSVAEHPPSSWRTADRLFVTAASSALAGLGASYAHYASSTCTSAAGYCRWRLENPGYQFGAVIGASVAGIAFSRGGSCTPARRALLTIGTSLIAAVPGAIVAESGRQAAVGITPILQAVGLELILKRCRN